MNQYVFVLNEQGERKTALCDNTINKDELLEQARLEFPDDTLWYVNDGDAILDKFMEGKRYLNGEWLDPIAIEVSAEEQQAKEAAQVASEYEAKFKAIDDEIIRAEVIDKDTEYANELRQQREALQLEFMTKRGEL
ncbi:hypothetical protein [Veillonella caviae]|uniref:hypothetical protein n=1 Tax=Veillonella caviae TaxID=248316 RepID=UPI0023F8753D|nr:hypothetical protein [Veillonella caviae]